MVPPGCVTSQSPPPSSTCKFPKTWSGGDLQATRSWGWEAQPRPQDWWQARLRLPDCIQATSRSGTTQRGKTSGRPSSSAVPSWPQCLHGCSDYMDPAIFVCPHQPAPLIFDLLNISCEMLPKTCSFQFLWFSFKRSRMYGNQTGFDTAAITKLRFPGWIWTAVLSLTWTTAAVTGGHRRRLLHTSLHPTAQPWHHPWGWHLPPCCTGVAGGGISFLEF